MGFYARIGNMAETCPYSETSRCRDRDETEALDLRGRDETETLKNRVSRPRPVSRHYSSGRYVSNISRCRLLQMHFSIANISQTAPAKTLDFFVWKIKELKIFKKIQIKSWQIFDLAFLQHRVKLGIPERAISATSVAKIFTERKGNILRQKNRKPCLSIERICMRLRNVNCE